MDFSKAEVFQEVLNAPRGSLILSSDSYLVESENWYQVVSPSRPDPSRNEVIFSQVSMADAEKKVDELIRFYRDLGTDFKWCTSPQTMPEGFNEILRKKGFKSWFSRGMYALVDSIRIPNSASIEVEPVTEFNVDRYLDLFMEGWETKTSLQAALLEDVRWALGQPDGRFHYFLAKSEGNYVGTAGFVRKKNSAYLIGGNVLERYRGKGFYKALIKKRLDLANGLGIRLVTTGAREHSSAPILERLGFETAFRDEIFQYEHVREGSQRE